MTANPVAWFEIYVQDMERAKRFYQAVFQVTLTPLASPAPEVEMCAFPSAMNQPGAAGALVKLDCVPSGGNSVLVYFHCDACEVEEGRVAAAGGKVVKPTFSIGQYGRIALVEDTEGNMFGLHSMD